MKERNSYRAERRNAVLRPEKGKPGVWQGIKPTGRVYHPPVRLNRSKHWAPKQSYTA